MVEFRRVDPDIEPPLHKVLGIEVGVGPNAEGMARIIVDPEKHYGNKWVHGGLVAPLTDIASGVAIAVAVPNPWRAIDGTIEMKINYIGKVYEGELIATAKLVHLGKRLAVTEVDITNGDRLVAKSVATFMLNREAIEGEAGASPAS